MTDLQVAKRVVRAHHAALESAAHGDVAAALARHTSPDWLWRGMHPFYEQTGADAVAGTFWTPLLTALTSLQRREDIFFAGQNDAGDGVWVCSMGHLMGLFDAPLLGILPHRRIAMLRYAEFHRVEGDRIVETAQFCDLVHLMMQAGQNPLPPQTGAHLVQPGPMTHDGLLYDDADPTEGERTLDVINGMVGHINNWKKYATRQEELAESWHDEMVWWGPAGIGATYTIDRYVEQHQGPFREFIVDRTFNGHVARIAEGNFGGFFGWANLNVTNAGGYLGMTAGSPSEMRIVDVYRRKGDKLAENWIFIDILHYLFEQGLDVLARNRSL